VRGKILLFIPMFNCEKQITRVLNQINEKVREYITEIIVVDNRSTDKSQEKVINYIENNKDKNIKLFLNTENYNLGESHKVAFNYAVLLKKKRNRKYYLKITIK
jgi:possible glycosyltransferase